MKVSAAHPGGAAGLPAEARVLAVPEREVLFITRMLLFRSLQRTLAELRDYQRKHEYWQSQNEKFIYNPDVIV